MNIDIFSDCVFTRGAFKYIAYQLNTDMHIAVLDVGIYRRLSRMYFCEEVRFCYRLKCAEGTLHFHIG